MNLCLNILGILSILIVVCLAVVSIISCYENHRLAVTRYQIKDILMFLLEKITKN